MPLIFSDGKIIRLENPALPCSSCLFENVASSGKPFKIFNNDGINGVVIAYNTTPDGAKVSGTISPKDAGLSGAKYYCAYDWFSGEAQVVGKEEEISVVLSGGNDFKMLLFVPIQNGNAIIGLRDKYICFAGIKNGKALDDGELLIYGTESVEINGCATYVECISDSLYKVLVKKNDCIFLK